MGEESHMLLCVGTCDVPGDYRSERRRERTRRRKKKRRRGGALLRRVEPFYWHTALHSLSESRGKRGNTESENKTQEGDLTCASESIHFTAITV